MRWFFRRRIPVVDRILVVESGSRAVTEALLPRLQAAFGGAAPIDLVTCHPGLPAGCPPGAGIFRVSEYAGRAGRARLYRLLRAANYSLLGIVCSGEPVMAKWKWALALRVPAKVFIVNENADFFWFDLSQRHIISRFALARWGLAGAGALRTPARLLLFPFTLACLLVYAAFVHTRRALRLLHAPGE